MNIGRLNTDGPALTVDSDRKIKYLLYKVDVKKIKY